jgi:tellurite resistance protein TehA-like permease
LLSLSIELPRYTGLFTKSIGLPYAHKMHDYIANNEVLQLNDIHSHWYLPIVPLIALPLVVPLFAASPVTNANSGAWKA